MKKEVVRFKRSTTIKDDICYESKNFTSVTDEKFCDDCRVHILTDRFLSENFQKRIMEDDRPYPRGTYPYVLITDTSKCNLRCRPCYSWIFWKPKKDRSHPVTLESEKLAELFECKVNKLHDESLLEGKRIGRDRWKRPFSRLRISGGEPLFDPKDPKDALQFWIEFFGHIDKKFDELIEDKITLMTESEWKGSDKEKRKQKFPIFLKSDSGNIRIRFDTNGFLFGDPRFADKFVKEIYDLNLQNFSVDLTYSLKGTNKHEVRWMIDPSSKYDRSKVGIKEPLKQHQQWHPLKNLKESIMKVEDEEILEKDPKTVIGENYFNSHGDISITVEKGIMNNPREKLYLYDKEKSLPWEKFEKQLRKKGLELSNTENRIYFGMNPKAKAWSYIKRGNYEITFRREDENNPLYSFSKLDKNFTNSKNHKKVTNWKGQNLKELDNKIKFVQNKNLDQRNQWIELIPLKID